MAVTLRLMRLGKRGKPFYRIIAVDKRKKRNGAYIENLGTYNPLVSPASISYNKESFDAWISKGAQISEGLARLIKYGKKLEKSSKKKA